MEKQLIVCADDFGLTRGVNKGIIHCYKNGILRSASLMANAPALEHATELYRDAEGLDLGIHLCLNDLAPVCMDFSGILVDRHGMFFPKYLEVVKKIVLYPRLVDQIKGEFRCQIEYLLRRDVRLSHINSHKHLHILPPLWKIVSELAREYRIPFVRYPVEGIKNLSRVFFKKGKKKNVKKLCFFSAFFLFYALYPQTKRKVSKEFIKSADFFTGLYNTGFLDTPGFADCIKNLRPGITELMCHPGLVDDNLKKITTKLVLSREKEVEALCSPEVMQAVKINNIKVTSFHECC